MNLEVVAEEGDNEEPLDADMNTLREAVVLFKFSQRGIFTQNIS